MFFCSLLDSYFVVLQFGRGRIPRCGSFRFSCSSPRAPLLNLSPSRGLTEIPSIQCGAVEWDEPWTIVTRKRVSCALLGIALLTENLPL
jgi:hypothetical protein